MAVTAEGMIAVTPDRTIRVMNEEAAEMLGVTRQEFMDKPLESLRVGELGQALDAALVEGAPVTWRFEYLGREYACSAAPYLDGEACGAVLGLRDETDMMAALHRSDAVLSSTGDGLLVFDADRRVAFVNPAATRMLGKDAESLIGQQGDPWTVLGLEPAAEGVCESGPQMREVRVEEPEHRIMDVRVDPVVDEQGICEGAVVSLHDVTAEREAMQMKNEFVSTVSHELRTPLTSIKGYIDLILEGEVGEINEMQREFLSIVKENSDRLVELINDMLDISRIESGRIVLKIQPLDVAERIEGAVNTFRAVADQQGRSINVDVPGDLPRVAGDADRVGQVLINFLSNAIKYSPAGGDVDVSASLADGSVRIAISDHGIGIAEEDQARLFTKFYRVDSTLTREIGGTGLGLSICKSIIELLGGQVGAQSAAGEGSTFWFTLPLAAPELVRTPSLEGPLGSPGGRILVVDESEEAANLVETYLTKRGYQVTKAFTSEEAWQKAIELQPRVVTLDVMLGEGAGFELLKHLKADERTADIPVVVLSIICDEGKSHRMGATGYLEKPIDKERLIEVVDTLIGSVVSPVALVVDDDRAIVDVLSRTLKQRGFAVMAAFDGKEALAAVERVRPHIILLDLRMPVMDGYEVLTRLKLDPETADIPIVIMSAYNFEAERADVLKLANVCTAKPFDVEEFVTSVEEAIREDGE